MSIGKQIKLIRQQKKITQKELAKRSGLAEITIRGYEAEKYNPKIENIRKISEALNISAWELLEDSPKDMKLDFINTQNAYLADKYKDKYSILKLAESIFDTAQEHEIFFAKDSKAFDNYDFYTSESFYLLRDKKNEIVLSNESLEKITDIMKKTLSALIEAEGISRLEYIKRCEAKNENAVCWSEPMHAVDISLIDYN